ncbi:hypothetical protein [Pseudomonas protegens]|uniref:hypothetical protein n=1 Tax=Pseudomonas protegens TaxID=380021 RepID=UPI000F484D29|nr:hypothetical protein [Pseudomonas protegens]ROL93221.1 hypothetical protein BK639_11815 [Pseudomonas protegens]ROL99393.1 hypothetical protein BK641_21780 [Pseudomonas protegens]ROM05380.1 hypothetical protein BK640_11870 [Pseudomonas protegens]ROM11855.1 hypothetical protein BK642_10515 [Pseudomonas protegens]
MTEIPTPESFYELSLAADRYVDRASKAIALELDKLAIDGGQSADLLNVAVICAQVLDDKLSEVLSGECKKTLEWLEAEPAFAMAAKSLAYFRVDKNHWEALILRELERWMLKPQDEKRIGASYKALTIARLPSHYITYISRVADASHRYVSGIGHRAVIEGPSTIRRMKDLIVELDEAMSAEWIPENLRRSLAFSLRTKLALQELDTCEEITSPSSRRNDVDLPTRLFAIDLLRVHQQIFRSFHKKTVFHLMGLSFVHRPLEMRTIERLAKSETDALREIVAKRIADKRGLDFDIVLTTLKANKSLTLPRENTD